MIDFEVMFLWTSLDDENTSIMGSLKIIICCTCEILLLF